MYGLQLTPEQSKIINDEQLKALKNIEWQYNKAMPDLKKKLGEAAFYVFLTAHYEAVFQLLMEKVDRDEYLKMSQVLTTQTFKN